MPKRSRKVQRKRKPSQKNQPRRDPNQAAFAAMQHVIEATEGTGKNPLAVALGRLGGLKGGKARAQRMTDAERSASASRAAQARWNKPKE